MLISALLDYAQMEENLNIVWQGQGSLQASAGSGKQQSKIRYDLFSNDLKSMSLPATANYPLSLLILQLAHKKLLQNSAEKYMHRKYFKEMMTQYKITKATVLQEIGEIEKSRMEIQQILSLAAVPGAAHASDITVFRIKSSINQLLNYVRNLVVKGIPL